MIKSFNIQQTAYYLFVICCLGWLGYIGRSILQPLVFAGLFSIFLIPVVRWFHQKIKINWLSIFLAFLTVLLPLFFVIMLFSMQLINIIESLPSITTNLEAGLEKAIASIQDFLPFVTLEMDSLWSGNVAEVADGPLKMLQKGLVSSSEILLALGMTFIYTFFILYYRKSFKHFIIYQFEQNTRKNVRETLNEIKETVQGYVGGLGIVIFMLAIVNSLGLWIIGIKYPLFWGALAGFLAIIPYIGTAIGGTLPFLYALATADHTWQPVAIVLFYIGVQQLEGNLITPKIVGDKVDVNPFFAILSLIVFGVYWGMAGIILALPIISIIRIFLDQFPNTKSLAKIMSTQITSKPSDFDHSNEEEDNDKSID